MSQGNVRRENREVPLLSRAAPIGKVDADNRTFELIWTTGARVRRYDWERERWYWEELSLDPEHVRMGRLQSGKASLLNSHAAYSLEAVLGVITEATLAKTEGRAKVRLSKRAEVQPILDDVRDGIISNVSCGYSSYTVLMFPPAKGEELWVYRAVDWEPHELSLVPIPADFAAGVKRSERRDMPRNACEFISPEPEEWSAARLKATIMQAERQSIFNPLEPGITKDQKQWRLLNREILDDAKRRHERMEREEAAAAQRGPVQSEWDKVVAIYERRAQQTAGSSV